MRLKLERERLVLGSFALQIGQRHYLSEVDNFIMSQEPMSHCLLMKYFEPDTRSRQEKGTIPRRQKNTKPHLKYLHHLT